MAPNEKHLNSAQKETALLPYPYHQSIVYVDPKTVQKDATSCGIFSIFHATNLLLQIDAANIEPRLNSVYGDQSLFMRFHIVRMFVNK